MRINKYLAGENYCTRREADYLIQQKRVKINGRIAVLGDKIRESDKVEVTEQKNPKKFYYIAYYKPRKIVTHSPQQGEKDIKKLLPEFPDFFPVGRLDKESHGLIILTNDGRVTDRLLNPKFEHEKEYEVKMEKELSPLFLRHLANGINIEGYKTKPAKVRKIGPKVFRITLVEGKKHQIRRMAAAFGYAVRDLKRIRVMNISLGNLSPGKYRKIEGTELEEFLKRLGIRLSVL